MESPVTGGITPLSLGELRQAILAVYIGNPLFSAEEQLLANHQAHEYEGAQELTHWLREARLEDAQRGFVARLCAVRTVEKPVVLDAQAQDAEMLALLACPALDQPQKVALANLFAFSSIMPTGRLRLLGDSYVRLLGAAGRAEPYCGVGGLFEN